MLPVIVLATSLVPGVTASAMAVQEKPCSSPQARAFDFWIGDWDIRQEILREDGTWLELPARTSVRASIDQCALVEEWQGQVQFFWEGMSSPQHLAGLSVRAFDPRTAKWYIHWMDSRSPRFGEPYSGGFADGVGEFTRETETAGGRRIDRITFSGIEKDAVTWGLSVSTDGGRTWRTIWRMHMRRAR